MTWSFVSAKQCFPQYAAHWDALNEQLHRSHALFASWFVGPLITHFASTEEVLAVHRHGVDVDGLLLLTPGRYKWTTFMPSQTQVAPMLVSTASSLAALSRELPSTVLALDLLCQDPEYSITPELDQNPGLECTQHVTTLNIELSSTFEEYWQARSRNLRQQLRRSLKKIEDAGLTPALHVHQSTTPVQQALANYASIESRSWKAQGGTAIQLDTTQGRFYSDMLTRAAQVGAAAIYELHLNEQLVASQIVVHTRGMMITLKTTYDVQYASFSPGTVLDFFILQHEFTARRFSMVEYYTNATPEVLRWGTAHRVISNVRLYRHSWLRPLIRGLRNVRALSARIAASSNGLSAPPSQRTSS